MRLGFSHFINIDFLSFTWYLVAAVQDLAKQSGVQDVLQDSELCRCLKRSKTYREVSGRELVQRNVGCLVSPT